MFRVVKVIASRHASGPMGADQIIDYSRERFERLLRDFDGALDLVGGDTLERSFAVLKRGGTVVSIAGMPVSSKSYSTTFSRLPRLAKRWPISKRVTLKAKSSSVSRTSNEVACRVQSTENRSVAQTLTPQGGSTLY